MLCLRNKTSVPVIYPRIKYRYISLGGYELNHECADIVYMNCWWARVKGMVSCMFESFAGSIILPVTLFDCAWLIVTAVFIQMDCCQRSSSQSYCVSLFSLGKLMIECNLFPGKSLCKIDYFCKFFQWYIFSTQN